MFQRIKTYLIESRQEWRHVNWPTRKDAIRLTSIVILIALVVAAFLGFFDFIFSYILRVIVS